jgi:hypothetical protein
MNKQNAPAKGLGEVRAMTMWFAAPLAVIFALATLSVPPGQGMAEGKAEKDKSEQTDKGSSKEKSGKGDENSSAGVSKHKRNHRAERQE